MRFLGLESFPLYRSGGRLEHYRGDPPLSDGAFAVLQRLVRAATENLEGFGLDATATRTATAAARFRAVIALTRLSVEEIAAPDAASRLQAAVGCRGSAPWRSQGASGVHLIRGRAFSTQGQEPQGRRAPPSVAVPYACCLIRIKKRNALPAGACAIFSLPMGREGTRSRVGVVFPPER